MIKLVLQPGQASYKGTPGNEVVRNQLKGGAGRYRRDLIGSTWIVSVRWPCTAKEFEYFWMFYRAVALTGSAPFLADLVIDRGDLTTHVSHIMPGTLNFACVGGPNYEIYADLEIEPALTDLDYEFSVVVLVDAFGIDHVHQALLDIREIVNVDMPEALPG